MTSAKMKTEGMPIDNIVFHGSAIGELRMTASPIIKRIIPRNIPTALPLFMGIVYHQKGQTTKCK